MISVVFNGGSLHESVTLEQYDGKEYETKWEGA